jgi:hypothetical protein
MLVLLIIWKESVKNKNIDVYLAPLMEELQDLWSGVDAWDVMKVGGQHKFQM